MTERRWMDDLNSRNSEDERCKREWEREGERWREEERGREDGREGENKESERREG